MPIVKTYAPPVDLIGQIAFKGGLGSFRQEEDRFNFARQQFAAEQENADRQFGMQQQALLARQQEAALQREMEAARLGMASQEAQDERQFRAMQNNQLADERLGDRLFDWKKMEAGFAQSEKIRELDRKSQFEEQRRREQFQISGKVLEDAEGFYSQLRGLELSPEGTKARKDFNEQLNKVRADSMNHMPGETAMAVRQVMDRFGSFDWGQHVVKPKTAAQEAQEQIVLGSSIFGTDSPYADAAFIRGQDGRFQAIDPPKQPVQKVQATLPGFANLEEQSSAEATWRKENTVTISPTEDNPDAAPRVIPPVPELWAYYKLSQEYAIAAAVTEGEDVEGNLRLKNLKKRVDRARELYEDGKKRHDKMYGSTGGDVATVEEKPQAPQTAEEKIKRFEDIVAMQEQQEQMNYPHLQNAGETVGRTQTNPIKIDARGLTNADLEILKQRYPGHHFLLRTDSGEWVKKISPGQLPPKPVKKEMSSEYLPSNDLMGM